MPERISTESDERMAPASQQLIAVCDNLGRTLKATGLGEFDLLDGRKCTITPLGEILSVMIAFSDGTAEVLLRIIKIPGGFNAEYNGSQAREGKMLDLNKIFSDVISER